jgi:hypothetical protein
MFGPVDDRGYASEQRRQLHARIARTRRRLNHHSSRLLRSEYLPLSWLRPIRNHPVAALATAAGAGMLFAQICAHSATAGKSADWLAQWLAGSTWTSLLRHVESFLSQRESTDPQPTSEQQDA